MDVLSRILERRAQVSLIGLGYAGLPLAVRAAEAGFTVTGYDIDREHVARLSSGESPFGDVTSAQLQAQISSGRFRATTDPGTLAGADVIVICVPTPLEHEFPNMSYIEAAAREVAMTLRPEQLVILESTSYPGTTEEFLLKILEGSGLKAGSDFFLGFSPERIDPGNQDFDVTNVPKIVGGIDEQSGDLMEAFYGSIVEKVVRVSSPKAAEMTKLLENTYRHVNIALVNEMAILCRDLGVDVWEVVEAAATKPFGFQAFYPGPGWGGHCIPVDPAYLSWRVRQMGATARFVELAREFNERMPGYVVERIGEVLNERGKSLKNSSVLVLGVTYKPDVPDVRESPAVKIIERLRKAGSAVSFNDPHVKTIESGTEALEGVALSDEVLSEADLILIHTDHSEYDWERVARRASLILDTRNALKGIQGPILKL